MTVELDIAYPDEQVFVDCLGFPWHSLPSALALDTVRGNGVVAAGWVCLGLTQEQFARRCPVFLRQLRTMLDDRRGRAASGLMAARPPVAW